MKWRSVKGEVRSAIWIALMVCATQPVFAATNSELEDEKLALSPPHGEIPPSFGEQYGFWAVLGFVLLLAIGVVAWFWLRPGPPAPTPIEVRTREELEALRRLNEDGKTLSRISRSLRQYLAVAFELPSGELTTSEFCQAIRADAKIGPDLAAKAEVFLRRCDELKFAPARSPQPIGAAAGALELVELGEARRAQLRQAAATATTIAESARSA
jgi:hypothetical protein